ncbi:MAG: FtsX-like permease family protein [Cyclobacteriaceae bacterium]
MSDSNRRIPLLAKWLITRFIPSAQLEEFLGDLQEMHDEREKTHGRFRASLLYWFDAIHLMTGFTSIRVFRTQKNSGTMLKHNLKLAFRSFRRFKTSFLINLVGLSSGLASVLLIYLWINDELSVDKFHERDSQLYQVMQNIKNPNDIRTTGSTPGPMGQALVDEMPEVEMSTSVMLAGSFWSDRVIEFEGRKLKMSDQYASADFFRVFSFPLLKGKASEVLRTNDQVVISEDFSNKLFGSGVDPTGQTVLVTDSNKPRSFIVSGVFKNLSKNSSLEFDVVFSLETFLEKYSYLREWGNSDPATYLVLKENANLQELAGKVEKFVAGKQKGYRNTHFLQKYSDRYLYGKYENGAVAGGRIQYVRLFSIIAGLVLLIACINFMNLSTARASRRLKEIGVKKAMGATRSSLISQYFVEAFLMTSVAIAIAGVIVLLLLPAFNTLTGKELEIVPDGSLMLSIFVIGSVTALLAGSYPALYLSGFDPIRIFRGKISGSVGDLWARRGLVIFQFSISILLISSVMVISSQINFIQNKNLGFKKDHVIYFNSDGELENSASSFIDELKKETSIINASEFGHDFLGNSGNTSGIVWEGKGEDEYIEFNNLEVGYGLIETFGLELAGGRTFSSEFGNEGSKILFNEKAIEAMGLENPIGKTIRLWGRNREIIGVVKDFHFRSLHQEISPCFFQVYESLSTIVIRIKPGNELETIGRIEELYQERNPGLTFNFKFFDQEYDALYHAEQQIASLSKSFGAVAILISCLGLFGLVAFTSERRQKEIGIRKVLGSGEYRLVILLTRDFSKMVGIAIMISLPFSYFLMKFWLQSFAYRIELNLWFFIGSGIFSMLIAWLIMSVQTIKAAKANPVEALKYE